jgi:hypothetical protein
VTTTSCVIRFGGGWAASVLGKTADVLRDVVLGLMHEPAYALNKIQFVTSIKTTTCFGTGVPSSGSFGTKGYEPNTLIWVFHCPYFHET